MSDTVKFLAGAVYKKQPLLIFLPAEFIPGFRPGWVPGASYVLSLLLSSPARESLPRRQLSIH